MRPATTNLTNTERNASEYMSSFGNVAESGGTALNHGDMTWGYAGSNWNMTNTGAVHTVNSYNYTSQQRGGFLSGNWYWTYQINDSSATGYSPSSTPTTNQAIQWVAATTTAATIAAAIATDAAAIPPTAAPAAPAPAPAPAAPPDAPPALPPAEELDCS